MAGLEPIDLSDEIGEPVRPSRPRRRWTTRRRRSFAIVAVALIVVTAATAALVLAPWNGKSTKSSSPAVHRPTRSVGPSAGPSSAPPTTTWTAPNGLIGLIPQPYVAIVDGRLVSVEPGAAPQRRIEDISGPLVIDAVARDSVLVSAGGGSTRVLVPRAGDGRDPLPAAIALLPSAQGRWWSNFGPLDIGTPRRRVATPEGTQALARLADGYVVADRARSQLMTWRHNRLLRIGVGPARVLAIAGSLVAWSDDTGGVVHLAHLDTGHTVDVATGAFALTARLSPDGSSIAMLVSAERDALVVADTETGRVVTRIVATDVARWVSAPDYLPPALLPVPFSWDATGHRLLIVGASPSPRVLEWMDGRTGDVTSSFEAPSELEQVVVLPR